MITAAFEQPAGRGVRAANTGVRVWNRQGMAVVRLHAILARVLADSGEPAQARAAMTAAQNALAHAGADELHDGVGGEFAFDEAKLS